ncbi:hypothetical protein BN13_10023 [Nostocoides jenkinsii Ben 74]|uniref:Uncharacterized protein n=1 Tax=Nostocoides jenkinsii Ben 74 TaxID=1193518 RepID=A0A077M674_9MICO|nr:hypothetical protein BN13_10023 [Tetrasphaera jenkinsii Ben 74]
MWREECQNAAGRDRRELQLSSIARVDFHRAAASTTAATNTGTNTARGEVLGHEALLSIEIREVASLVP